MRRSIYEKYGFTFGASYQQLFQWTAATARTANYDTALGGWAAFSTTWTSVDWGGPYEGVLVVRGAFRDSLGDNAVPAVFGLRDIGSLWSNYEWTSWNQGFRIEDLFWYQKVAASSASALAIRVHRLSSTSFASRMRGPGLRAARPLSMIPYPTF